MATGGSQTEADDSVNSLTCAICLENYRRPKLLPCFHTFCQNCLQGVAGTSPSLPCPSCRRMVLLPPGGVTSLQTNFYIQDASDTSSTSSRRVCDVCADDREATHSCLQCQQRYCLPCRKYHDAFTLSRGHTVAALTEEDEGCGKGMADKPKVDPCPKHPDQRLLLHCTQCKVNLCLQCKLTLHEGHPTLDLTDASAKVKDKLKNRLGSLTQDIQEIDHTLGAFDDRCSKLQEHRGATEAAFRARADTLHQWVKQSLEEAVSSLQSSSKQLAKPWRDRAEQLGNRKRALQAQQEHILRVLTEGQESDLVSLEAQLSSRPEEDVTMTQMKAELSQDMPTFCVEYNPSAVNPVQLRAFVGMLSPQTSGPERTVTAPVLPSSLVQGKAPAAVSEKEPDLTMHGRDLAPCAPRRAKPTIEEEDRRDCLPSTTATVTPVQFRTSISTLAPQQQSSGVEETTTPCLDPVGKIPTVLPAKEFDVKESDVKQSDVKESGVKESDVKQSDVKESDAIRRTQSMPSATSLVNIKKPPREWNVSSKNPQVTTVTICPISQDRLWVVDRSLTSNLLDMRLVDAEGQVLTTVHNLRGCFGLVSITTDIVLSWVRSSRYVHLITSDGGVSLFDMEITIAGLVSSAANGVCYVREINRNSLQSLKFMSKSQQKEGSVTPSFMLTDSEVVFENIPSSGVLRDVSSWGRYFVFLDCGKVEVYSRTVSRSPAFVCSYKPKNKPKATDARFCLLQGREKLLVTAGNDDKVHVIDHTDGGRFLGYLDTGPLNLHKPYRLATDYDRHVWILCEAGKVVVVDL